MEQTRGGSGVVMIFLVIVVLLAVLAGPQIGAALATIPAADLTSEQEMQATLDGFVNIVYDPAYSHAAQEHPESYEAVRKCIGEKGPYVTFQIVPKQRYLHVCLIDEVTVGFMIVDLVNKLQYEKTAYIKDAIRCINDVFKYASKVGYPRFKGPLP